MKKKSKSKAPKAAAPAVESVRAAAERAKKAARASKDDVRSAKSKLKAAKKALKAAEKVAKKSRKEARRALRKLKALSTRRTAGKKRHGARRGSSAGKPSANKPVLLGRRAAKEPTADTAAVSPSTAVPAAIPDRPTE